MARTRRGLLAGVALTVLVALGAGVAVVLADELGIRSEPSDIPAEVLAAAPEMPSIAPPEFTAITAPPSFRMELAVDELHDAVDDAEATEGSATLEVVIGQAEAAAGDGAAVGDDDESYRLEGAPDALRVVAASEAGAVLGVYDLASAVRDRRSITEHLGETVESRLGFRMVDLGAVGVTVDESEWVAGDDYSHNSKAFADVILAEAPYIDDTALAVARTDFEAYVRHALAEGYNAIAIPGFVEYLTFSGVGDGTEVYDADDTHVARALAMREAFGPMWEYAHDAGLDVYFRTDMLTLTTPLEEYLVDRFGSLATEDPEFWDVYSAGLDELYAEMPFLDGVLIRIGEAGRVYDLPGWDYYSKLAVTTVDSVRAMLTAFTEQAEHADREVIFRSWSVGVGAVGDMHTNDASYEAVLGGIDSEALIVSTKYTLGDFYSHLPLNHTLEIGEQRRIVEFQSRREFENFGAFPNDLGVLYQEALQRFIAANPNVEGIWTWTQDGGPWRAGPLSLELKAGFWQLYELNTELAVRLARDPEADPAAITADWARRWFSGDPATVQAIGEAMAQSRARHHRRALHRPVRRPPGLRDRPRTAAHDVDLRVGHPHRRQRRAERDLRDQPRRARRGDRGRRPRDRRGRAHAVGDRGDGCRGLARPRTAYGVPRHPRLPGQHLRHARRLPRDVPAPGGMARHRRFHCVRAVGCRAAGVRGIRCRP